MVERVANQGEPTVSASHLKTVVDFFSNGGNEAGAGFNRFNIALNLGRYTVLVEPKVGRVPLQRVTDLHLAYGVYSQDPYYGLKLAKGAPLMGYQMAINVFHQLQVSAQFNRYLPELLRLFSDVFQFVLRRVDGGYILEVVTDHATQVSSYQYDGTLVFCKKIIEFFQPNVQLRWLIPGPLSTQEKSVYQSYLGEVGISDQSYQVFIPSEYLVSEGYFDTNYFEASLKTVEKYHARQNKQSALVEAVWQSMSEESGSLGSVADVSERLGLTARQLQYRLKEFGINYQVLVDGHFIERCTQAIQAADGNVTADQLAELLGFSDARSFKRSFKRWFGMPLSQALESRISIPRSG